MQTITIEGVENGRRVESRILEERIQQAIAQGHREIVVEADGQHGIGGRLWRAGSDSVRVRITGSPGQRIGAMGFPNTLIEVLAPASDDVGWLNAGATIVVRGDATNGVGNAMAQGRIYIGGDIGARGMTMTKHNPKYDPPQLWVLGGAGDSFAEFMAGGVAVICGVDAKNPFNILGHRPCVGMVGGKIFFRGPYLGHSETDARLMAVEDTDWDWLRSHLPEFLASIERTELYETLTADRAAWSILEARKSYEKSPAKHRSMARFKREVWDKELKGGLIADLDDSDRTPVPVIATGELRRFVPSWENEKYLPPCQAGCPSGIPVQKRWDLIRKGRMDAAVDLSLHYTPFPATVCGYLCPEPCCDKCTRAEASMYPVDVSLLGKASINANAPKPKAPTGRKVAVIGGGPAGLSVAWQLWLKGHTPVVFERARNLGGKIGTVIPESRIPKDVVDHEIGRILERIDHIDLGHEIKPRDFEKIVSQHDFVVIAGGAQTPRMPKVEGIERAVSALDFLGRSKAQGVDPGKRVVIIGAGNVGCDVATEAARQGATDITLIDIQEPASFGKERQAAEAAGAKFLWPVFTQAVTERGVKLTSGELLEADTVVVSIGDQPELSFLPPAVEVERGFIKVDENFRTSDPHVYAIGDIVRPGLLTDAIGAGRKAAAAIDARLMGLDESYDQIAMKPVIDTRRVKLEYYDPQVKSYADVTQCAAHCASCGGCRDCGLCETLCPQQAISRRALNEIDYEYIVDGQRCIGCGFCMHACPCGIWELRPNDPLG